MSRVCQRQGFESLLCLGILAALSSLLRGIQYRLSGKTWFMAPLENMILRVFFRFFVRCLNRWLLMGPSSGMSPTVESIGWWLGMFSGAGNVHSWGFRHNQLGDESCRILAARTLFGAAQDYLFSELERDLFHTIPIFGRDALRLRMGQLMLETPETWQVWQVNP